MFRSFVYVLSLRTPPSPLFDVVMGLGSSSNDQTSVISHLITPKYNPERASGKMD